MSDKSSPGDAVRMKRICLNMIVKNESRVIRRCLNSVLPLISGYALVDTGSSDDTIEIMRQWMRSADAEGEIVERPWVNFGHNRNEALKLALDVSEKYDCDYILFIDADEQILAPAGNGYRALTDADACEFRVCLESDLVFLSTMYGEMVYDRALLIRADRAQEWYWKGALHEYITSDKHHTRGNMPQQNGILFVTPDGARSQDPQKFVKDAALLQAEYDSQTQKDTRTTFYLAQSYKDAGNIDQSLHYYAERFAQGGWIEERYQSMYRMGCLYDRKGETDLAIASFVRAWRLLPRRNESLVSLCQIARRHGNWDEVFGWATIACSNVQNGRVAKTGLFIDRAAHSWVPYDDLAQAHYWTGNREVGSSLLSYCLEMMNGGLFPSTEENRAHVKKNLSYFQ